MSDNFPSTRQYKAIMYIEDSLDSSHEWLNHDARIMLATKQYLEELQIMSNTDKQMEFKCRSCGEVVDNDAVEYMGSIYHKSCLYEENK